MLALHAPQTSDDLASIAVLRRGDPTAISRCYREHADALLALAYRLTGNASDAEDVVQDVFIGLPEALRRYEERGSFASWLKRITARRALMVVRSAKSRRETPRALDAIPSHDTPIEGRAIRMDVDAALRALSPALRHVFILKVVEGYSHDEIGSMLGISAGTSETRLCRAVARLRILLER